MSLSTPLTIEERIRGLPERYDKEPHRLVLQLYL